MGHLHPRLWRSGLKRDNKDKDSNVTSRDRFRSSACFFGLFSERRSRKLLLPGLALYRPPVETSSLSRPLYGLRGMACLQFPPPLVTPRVGRCGLRADSRLESQPRYSWPEEAAFLLGEEKQKPEAEALPPTLWDYALHPSQSSHTAEPRNHHQKSSRGTVVGSIWG